MRPRICGRLINDNYFVSVMSNRFAPYKEALQALSARTKTPLPSLILSFAVLHELTALVPLVGVFYGAKVFGVGEKVVSVVVDDDPDGEYGWVRVKCKNWVEEGELWAGRVGRRYGVFGFEKGQTPDEHRHEIAGDVANAVFAYGITKVSIVPLVFT